MILIAVQLTYYPFLQLKLHIQQQTINPKIPDTYMPTAVNNETFESMINNVTNRPISNLQLSARKLLHDCPIVITIFTILLVIIVLIMYICSGSLKKRGELPLNNQTKATIVSIAFVSFVRIVIFLGLDTEAIKYRHDHQGSKVIAIYNNVTMKDIYSTPWILLAFDTIALGFHIVITFIAFLHIYLFSTDKTTRCYTTMRKMFWYLQNTCHIWNDFNYYCLSLTVVPMIISGLNHAPYIIMAYVSDGAFASSIFLYYMIALFVEFGLIQFTLKTYFDSPASNRNYRRYVSSCLMIVQAPVISLLINGLMATTFLYLFFMPIKYVLRNAPSQVVVVYQSAALFVGAYITYKAVFKAEKNETKITKESKEMEISRLILERAHTDVNDEARRSFLKLKVTHRRQEVMLTDINGKVNNILDGHIDQIEADNIVALHDEHSRILKRLGEYIAANRDAADEDRELQHEKKEEVHHLEKVTATQLHHKIIQLWRESAQRNDKRIKSLTEEFKGLPEGLVRTDLSHAKTIYFPDENVHFCNPWLCSTCCNPQNLSEGPSERHPSVQ